MTKKILSLVLCAIICFSLCSCKEEKATKTDFVMNTMVSITVYGKDAQKNADLAIEEAMRIEKLLSSHIDTSDISKINKSAHIAPVKVSDETIVVLLSAYKFSEKTKGAFDISIKPLSDLWNVGAQNPELPSKESIEDTKKLVSYKDIEIKDGTVFFKKEGMAIELGGAAKGYAADKICELLKLKGVKNALIDLGGNIYAMGKNDKGSKWRIGLQKPDGQRGEYFSVESISDLSVVTSGSYERYFEKDGKIYHHIMDSKTGYPARSGLISASVIAKSSFEADMLSTAIFVMGYSEFYKIKGEFDFEKVVCVDSNNVAREIKK